MSSRYERDSGSRRESRDRRRSPGPSSSRRSPSPPKPKPRDDELPEAFGRVPDEDVPEDESNVLQRMKKNFNRTPLGAVVKCLDENRKIKIWTRNFKEVRGICTGYVVAFDKHWNLMMTDVDEVYLKPKRAKTPFIYDVKTAEKFKEIPKKEPRKKNQAAAGTEKEGQSTEQENIPPAPKEAENVVDLTETEKSSNPEGEKKKKRKKRAKNAATTTRRHVKQMFVRGDNIVMCAILGEDD